MLTHQKTPATEEVGFNSMKNDHIMSKAIATTNTTTTTAGNQTEHLRLKSNIISNRVSLQGGSFLSDATASSDSTASCWSTSGSSSNDNDGSESDQSPSESGGTMDPWPPPCPAEPRRTTISTTWEPDMAERIRKAVTTNPVDAHPFMVGFVGGPGTGKSVSAFLVAKMLEENGIPTMILPQDGYHYPLAKLQASSMAEDYIYRRGAPDTLDPQALQSDLKRIRGRRSARRQCNDEGDGNKEDKQAEEEEDIVTLPAFDHATADPEPDTHIFDRKKHRVVLCEGLYLLHDQDGWEMVRDMFDLTIYIDVHIDICMERVKSRNLCIPGYTEEEILRRTDIVDRTNAMTVLQSRTRADIVIDASSASTSLPKP